MGQGNGSRSRSAEANTATPYPTPCPTPDFDDVIDRLHVVQLPLRTSFRGLTTREVALFEGPAGWGEFAAFLEYPPAEAAQWLACALEMAFVGAPTPLRPSVEVNGTIPASVPPRAVDKLLARYPGIRTVKIKVGEQGTTLADDLERVAAVHAAAPELRIRCDANAAWSVSEAFDAALALAEAAGGNFDYLEQPCRTTAELAELRQRLADHAGQSGLADHAGGSGHGAPEYAAPRIAADESIRRAGDSEEVMRLRAADVAVIKAAPMGGPRTVLALAERFAVHGMSITVSSALESVVGMYAGLATAAALPAYGQAFRHTDIIGSTGQAAVNNAAGLGTGSLFLHDVAEPRPIINGHIDATPVIPDPARLTDLAAPPARLDWWRNRVRACLPHLPNLLRDHRTL